MLLLLHTRFQDTSLHIVRIKIKQHIALFQEKRIGSVERKRMEESSILENAEGQWLDFLPAKTSEEPGRVGAEVGFHHF